MTESERALAAIAPTLPGLEASIREDPTRSIRPSAPVATLVGSPGTSDAVAERVPLPDTLPEPDADGERDAELQPDAAPLGVAALAALFTTIVGRAFTHKTQ